MSASPLRPALLATALMAALMATTFSPSPVAADAEAPAKISRPDVPGEVVIAPTPRQRERRALRQLLAERHAELAALQARTAAAPMAEQTDLQVAIEQHKRATRLALLDRQLGFAQARGDFTLARRLEVRRSRAAMFVTAPLQDEVAR